MSGHQFDNVVQRLDGASSRRRVLAGVLVGATSLVTGVALTEAKRGGKGKARGKGKGNGTLKVQMCHRSKKGQAYELITIGSPAAKAHLKHGDAQCEAAACQTGLATGCNTDGTCIFALAAAGTACTVNGASGSCTAEGVCDTSAA